MTRSALQRAARNPDWLLLPKRGKLSTGQDRYLVRCASCGFYTAGVGLIRRNDDGSFRVVGFRVREHTRGLCNGHVRDDHVPVSVRRPAGTVSAWNDDPRDAANRCWSDTNTAELSMSGG